MNRRLVLALPMLLTGCSVLPDRPFIDSRRYPLEPRREGPPVTGARRALLMRSMRAAPGLEQRGLRRLRANGTIEILPYEEWLAPPADLAEAALRQWLIASGRFTAVTAPGSRLATSLILETELLLLQAEPGRAHAAMTALLLNQSDGLGDPRVLAQSRLDATVPLAPPANPASQGAAEAAAMQMALGSLLEQMEGWVSSKI